MYRILADNLIIYDPRMPDYTVYNIQCNIGLNQAGRLTFTMPESHPHYGMIRLMKSIVELWDDDFLVFRGRPFAPTVDLFKQNVIDCEGELAFFNDTYQPPFEYTGSVAGLFGEMLARHNEQASTERQFKLGNVTVVNDTQDGNVTRSSMDYMSTWDFIHDKFTSSNLGGYLWIRHEADGNYIDYVPQLNYYVNQGVTQAVNLIDAHKSVSSETLATAIVPLGKQLEDADGQLLPEWTTIKSVNDGKEYIKNDEAVAIYGWISKTVHHDDITDPSNLMLAGMKDLGKALGVITTYEFKSADLSKAGYNVSPFILGTYVDVNVPNLDVASRMLVSEMTIYPQMPNEEVLVIGDKVKTLTQGNLDTLETIENTANDLRGRVSEQGATIIRLRREITSEIGQTAEMIYSMVAENYYSIEQTDQLVASISTQIQQTADAITFWFNQFIQEQEATNTDVENQFLDISKYIRFEDGNIILGVVGNELMLRIQNDRIMFLENGAEIAYWANRKFYAVDGEFINSLRLGKFAFLPRANGNLSFKKVVE